MIVTGIPVDALENCMVKHDLMSCWEFGEQATIATKMRLAGMMYRGLRAAMRGCGECFLPGTRVLMGDGKQKPIERVHTGDLVRATDPTAGETGAHRVTRQIVSKGDKHLTAITIRGPTGHRGKVTATADHPFWSPSLRTWAAAGDLRTGDTLCTDRGAEATVTAVRSYDRPAVTYQSDRRGPSLLLGAGGPYSASRPRKRSGDCPRGSPIPSGCRGSTTPEQEPDDRRVHEGLEPAHSDVPGEVRRVREIRAGRQLGATTERRNWTGTM
ncbi:hypothetical protein E5082_31480 [Streptomyces griseoluteus]|uniref:Hint domain-containing protein n=1 Tax=Streptomyces griseoluteus TaxID=29306 RepID=A0A4Z1CX28_STRGP|nr:hypothetical protein E5082_31480 [Streptomyces griseoluteus]